MDKQLKFRPRRTVQETLKSIKHEAQKSSKMCPKTVRKTKPKNDAKKDPLLRSADHHPRPIRSPPSFCTTSQVSLLSESAYATVRQRQVSFGTYSRASRHPSFPLRIPYILLSILGPTLDPFSANSPNPSKSADHHPRPIRSPPSFCTTSQVSLLSERVRCNGPPAAGILRYL
jgi:hypothetical protein